MSLPENFRSSYEGVQSLNRIGEWTEDEIVTDLTDWQQQRGFLGRSERSLHEIDFILYSEQEEINTRQTEFASFMAELGLIER